VALAVVFSSTIASAAEGPVNPLSPEALKPLRAAAARQNEAAIQRSTPAPRTATEFNEQRNIYFGDTHVHTALSFDAYLAGGRLGIQDAYRFAMGEPLTLVTGETARLSRPLDFVVMTDHAESFGLFVTCAREDLTERQRVFCDTFESPSAAFFMQLRTEALTRPPVRTADLCEDNPAACVEDARTTWREVLDAAEKYNKPGQFSAFAGYEYSPVLPKQGKIHRNVIFKNSTTPDRVVSAFEAATVLDLWSALEEECTGKCEFLTIPHNMNKTWGIAYSGRTMDGDAYDDKDWALRGRSEPLAEIFQIKGNSECGYGLGANDEECNFELIAPLCEGEQVPGCSGRTSFAREGLKEGLRLQKKLGFNPLRFGFVGSTDTHNSTPGDTEEYDYRGSSTLHESPAMKRLGKAGGGMKGKNSGAYLRLKTPGGLAAVWAKENSRDAIFEAMEQRETYATSGNRIQLRFFAGRQFEQDILANPDFLKKAYDAGVPMGSVLPEGGAPASPEFLVWALQDGNAAPLQKVQMIKAWMEGGEAREKVVDIACSDGLTPDPKTGRCPNNGAKVDISNCTVSADKGDSEIKVRWKDPAFDVKQAAVYYIRVLENPSCRWSTYDSIRIGEAPPTDVPATIQERAWSSPIWYSP
jgi:hypothetical protein